MFNHTRTACSSPIAVVPGSAAAYSCAHRRSPVNWQMRRVRDQVRWTRSGSHTWEYIRARLLCSRQHRQACDQHSHLDYRALTPLVQDATAPPSRATASWPTRGKLVNNRHRQTPRQPSPYCCCALTSSPRREITAAGRHRHRRHRHPRPVGISRVYSRECMGCVLSLGFFRARICTCVHAFARSRPRVDHFSDRGAFLKNYIGLR